MGTAATGMVATGRAGCPQVRPTAWARFDKSDDTYHPAFAVQLFANLTQLPESTFMVTKLSFFAPAGVVHRRAQLRNGFVSEFELFGLARWLRDPLTESRGASEMSSELCQVLTGLPMQDGPVMRPSKPPLNMSEKSLSFSSHSSGSHTRCRQIFDRA
jgi:hypothetical protein